MLDVDGLRLVQRIDVDGIVLDVAFCRDRMYVSLDAREGDWVVEYVDTGNGWEKVDTEKWRITKREETVVDLYNLESNRKRIGIEED